ncbi:MAG: hypothetical protein U0Q18_01815 [Bryobacteraceae bacterium]
MRIESTILALAIAGLSLAASPAEKARVFITESHALQLSSDAAAGAAAGALSVTGGQSPENVEVMKAFLQKCPEVLVTSSREKADYLIRFDHEAINPTTPFVRGNKVAIFDKNEDLIYSDSTRLLANAVKGACSAIGKNWHK